MHPTLQIDHINLTRDQNHQYKYKW